MGLGDLSDPSQGAPGETRRFTGLRQTV
jgi:hypothetical protein